MSHLICDGNQTPLDSVELTASSEYNSDHAVDQICLNNQPYGSKTGEFTQSSCAWASPGNFPERGIVFSKFIFRFFCTKSFKAAVFANFGIFRA